MGTSYDYTKKYKKKRKNSVKKDSKQNSDITKETLV
jgi:hypothetical protein